MALRLLVAGSNSGCQLGVAHDEDVRTLRETLCRTDPNGQATTSFPPTGFTVTEISSGANHTLALVQSLETESKEIWVTGTGAQGQLGPSFALKGTKARDVFVRLDLEACIKSTGLSEYSFEPSQVVCGWNCSYIVLTPRNKQGQEALISLGFHRENNFGELGCDPCPDAIQSCVHVISFGKALAEVGIKTDVPFKIADVTAGLRHAVAVLDVQAGSPDQERSIVVGWGSARHGQVGKVPKSSQNQPGSSTRPGPAPMVVLEPQLIFDRITANLGSRGIMVRAGRDFSVVKIHLRNSAEDPELHYLGKTRPREAIDAFALPPFQAYRKDIVDMTSNWNSVHLIMRQRGGTGELPCIFSCGSNGKGQLGNGTRVSTPKDSMPSRVDLDTVLLGSASASAECGTRSNPSATKVTILKMISGSEHSLLLVKRERVTAAATEPDEAAMLHLPETEVWGWGWNEHGNLAQGPHDEADRDRPVRLLNGKRSGAATLPRYTPLDIWAGCGTTFILADRLSA